MGADLYTQYAQDLGLDMSAFEACLGVVGVDAELAREPDEERRSMIAAREILSNRFAHAVGQQHTP